MDLTPRGIWKCAWKGCLQEREGSCTEPPGWGWPNTQEMSLLKKNKLINDDSASDPLACLCPEHVKQFYKIVEEKMRSNKNLNG